MDPKPYYPSSSILFGGIIFVLALWVVNFFGLSLPISITTTATSGELSVVGEGKVSIVPDTAEISAGITVNNVKTAEEAQQQISQINNKIIAAVSSQGIKKEDISTSSYSVNPDYNNIYQPTAAGVRNNPSGYSGNATVTIKVRDSAKVGGVITAATTAGATNVYNNGFTVDDPSKYREQARDKAIQNAKEQANRLASQLGIRLGKITNIVESNGSIPIPYMAKDSLMSAGSVPPVQPNIEPGSQEVSSTVTLYFERR